MNETKQVAQRLSRFPQYIAWLNGCSVARSHSADDAIAKAIEIANTSRWRQHNDGTMLRLTKGAHQTVVFERPLFNTEGGAS